MGPLPTNFIQRNHTYEVPHAGHHRTYPIQAVDGDTFKGKLAGTKGWLVIEPNCKVLISVELFLDGGMVGIFVEKFNSLGSPKEPFGAIIDKEILLQLIQKPDRY